MVLLKNAGVLPLKKPAKVAFIGEFARTPRFQGGGSSNVNAYKVTSALEADGTMDLQVSFAPGYAIQTAEPDEAMLREAAETAKNADVAVVFVGITDAMESEGFDRRTLSMPKNHEALVEAVSKVQKNTVVVVMCGGCITMPWLDDVRGVLYAYLGGEAVGPATTTPPASWRNPSRSGWRTTRPTSTTSATSRTAPNTARACSSATAITIRRTSTCSIRSATA